MTASSTDNGHITPGKTQREKLRKAELIELLLKQREEALLQLEDKDRRIAELSDELTRLKGEIDKEQSKQTRQGEQWAHSGRYSTACGENHLF